MDKRRVSGTALRTDIHHLLRNYGEGFIVFRIIFRSMFRKKRGHKIFLGRLMLADYRYEAMFLQISQNFILTLSGNICMANVLVFSPKKLSTFLWNLDVFIKTPNQNIKSLKNIFCKILKIHNFIEKEQFNNK